VSAGPEQYPGSVISQSWISTEQTFQSAMDVQAAKYHQVYQQAVESGCTVLAASGDWGTANTDKQNNVYPFPTVAWPASDPLVTACGGTQLQWGWRWNPAITADQFWAAVPALGWLQAIYTTGIANFTTGAGLTEAVWNEPYMPNATGGGLSAIFPTPAFQSGLPQTLLKGCRGVPDISWNATVNGGVMVYMSASYGSSGYVGPWALVGGTSASTPELAGLIALANQLRAQNGKGSIGYLNAILYQLPADDFNDILPQTFGPVALNDNTQFGSGVPGFPTTPGYDLTTGLGSPRAYKFVHDLADLAL
jgi:subtilase family serine protease